MKAHKLVVALASVLLLTACGNNTPASSASSQPASTSAAAKTMNFLKDGQFYLSVPNDVLAPTGTKTPSIKLNGIAVQGVLYHDLNGKFELSAEGTFTKDLYVTIAKSEQEGHISAKAYGSLNKDALNEAFATINVGTGVPNKVFVCFSTTKATWDKGLDNEMDQEIGVAWDLLHN